MAWRVEIGSKAQRDLDGLDAKVRERILHKLIEMRSDPFKSASKLKGHRHLYRTRVSDWRIVFTLEAQAVVVKRVM